MYTNDVRYLPGRSNAVADLMSRPEGVPLGTAYQLPDPDPDYVDVPTLAALHNNGNALETVGHSQLAKAHIIGYKEQCNQELSRKTDKKSNEEKRTCLKEEN